MVSKGFFERPSMEVAIDLGLRKLRFSKKGALYIPEDTREVLITRTVPYGVESGYEPEKTKDGKAKKSVQGGLQAPGFIDMYFTPYGPVLAISTGREGEFSEVSINAGIPISGFDSRDLGKLLEGPIKLTKALGIDREVAKMLDRRPIYDNPMIAISDEKAAGNYGFNQKKISKDALGSFSFMRG